MVLRPKKLYSMRRHLYLCIFNQRLLRSSKFLHNRHFQYLLLWTYETSSEIMTLQAWLTLFIELGFLVMMAEPSSTIRIIKKRER